jgi:hypothetical protein
MLIKNGHNTLLATLLVASSLLVSGCSFTSSPAPISKVHKDFKDNYDLSALAKIITDTAIQQDWKITNQTTTSIKLEKTYQKSRMLTSTHERWKRVTVDTKIYADVDLNQKFFNITLSEQSKESLKTNCDRELFNEDIKLLEQAIDAKLSEKVL